MTKKKKLRAGELGKYFFLFIIPALAIYLIFSITPFFIHHLFQFYGLYGYESGQSSFRGTEKLHKGI